METDSSSKQKRSKLKILGYSVLAFIVVVVSGFFLTLQYYKHQHEATIARLAERGFHTTMETLNAAHPPVPEAEDAMVVYRAADKEAFADKIQVCSSKEGDWQYTPYNKRSTDLEPQLFELLTELEPWEEQVLAATKLPGLNITWEENEVYMGQSQKELSSLRHVMKYLGDQCYSAVLRKQPDEAMTWVEAQFRLMEQSASAQFLIGGMIRNAKASVLLDSVQVALERDIWHSEQLTQVDELLAAWNPEQMFTDAMVSEVGYSVILMNKQAVYQGFTGPAMYYIYSGFYDFYDQLIVGDAPDFTIDRAVLSIDPESQSVFIQIMLPNLQRSALEVDTITVKRDFARLSIGLKQYKASHGAYPDSLSVLDAALLEDAGTAPDIGKRYAYTAAMDGFTLSYISIHNEIKWGCWE